MGWAASSPLHCPRCGGTSVKILDRGKWKRLLRLFIGTNRLYCRECRVTWRENQPGSAKKMRRSTKTKHLPVRMEGDWRIVVLPEDGWQRKKGELTRTVEYLIDSGSSQIMLDMSRPQIVTSASFGLLLKFHKRCRAKGGSFKVCRASEPVRDAIRLTSLEFLLAETT